MRTCVIWAVLVNASVLSRKALLSGGIVSSPPTFRRFGMPPVPSAPWQRTQANCTYSVAPSLTCWLACGAAVPPGTGVPVLGASGVARLAQPAATTMAAASAPLASPRSTRLIALSLALIWPLRPRW